MLNEGGASAPLIIRPVQNGEMDDVYRITYDAYLDMNYCEYQSEARLIHYPHLDNIPETTVLIAEEDGGIVGTASLTLDGEQGLNVDSDYKAECDKVRTEGRRLAAAWRLVTTDHDRRVVMGLIGHMVHVVISFDVETCLFTFNPHHEGVYKRLLNMETISGHNSSVQGLKNAPSVLMRWDVEKCPSRWLPKAA